MTWRHALRTLIFALGLALGAWLLWPRVPSPVQGPPAPAPWAEQFCEGQPIQESCRANVR